MKREEIRENDLPVISINQLEILFADLILWYDRPYCKNTEGANEVVAEYMSNQVIIK